MSLIDSPVTSRDSYTRSTPLSPKQIRTVNESTSATRIEKTTYVMKESFKSIPKRSDGADSLVYCSSISAGVTGAILCCTPLAPIGVSLLSAWLGFMALIEGGRRIAHNTPETLRSEEYQIFKQKMIQTNRDRSVKQMIDNDEVLKHFKCPISGNLPVFPVNLMPCHDPKYSGRATYDYESMMKLVKKGRTEPIYRDEPRLGGKVYYDFYHANTTIVRLMVIISKINFSYSPNYNPDPRIRYPDATSTRESDIIKRGDIAHLKGKLKQKKDTINNGYQKALIDPFYTPDSDSVYDQFPSVKRPPEEELKERVDELSKTVPEIFPEKESGKKPQKSEFSVETQKNFRKFKKTMFCKKIVLERDGCVDYCCGDIFRSATNYRPKITCTADLVSATDVRFLQREIERIYATHYQMDEDYEKEYGEINPEIENKYEYERLATEENAATIEISNKEKEETENS